MRAEPTTAALASAGLIGGYAVAVSTGSRPLGGVVLIILGAACIAIWYRRHGVRRMLLLTAGGLLAFGLSHGLGAVIGAWPAVLVTAAATFAAYWSLSDSRDPQPAPVRPSGRRLLRAWHRAGGPGKT